jgi:hypothetical protein
LVKVCNHVGLGKPGRLAQFGEERAVRRRLPSVDVAD